MSKKTESKSQAMKVDSEESNNSLSWKNKGNDEYKKKNYAKAIEYYSKAIDMDSNIAAYYGNRAAAYMNLYKYNNALNDCVKALDLDNKYKKAYIRGIKCNLQIGNIDNAIILVNNGLNTFKNDKELKQNNNKIEIIKMKIGRVNTKLNKISKKHNSLFDSQLNNDGKIKLHLFNYANKNNNNNSDDNSNSEEKKNDDNKDKNNNDSNNNSSDESSIDSAKLNKTDEQDIKSAISIIKNLLDTDMSSSINIKCLEIKALIILQKYEEALSKSTNLLRFNQNNYNIIKLRAISLFKTNNNESAIKHVKSLLKKDPDNKECRNLFKIFKSILKLKEDGNAAFKNKEYDIAIKKYTECIKIDLTNHLLNSKLFCNRAAVYLILKKYQNALNDCNKAINADETYTKAYVRASQACIELEEYQDSVNYAEKACKIEPNSKEWRNNFKKCKLELKKSKRKNYYKILGVTKDATEKEIKKGFRKQAAKSHPDRFSSGTDDEKKKAEDKFKEIGEAYEVLKDPKMKQRYDAGYDLDEIKEGKHSPFGGGNVDISHIFDLFNQSGGFGGRSGGFGGGNGGTFTFRMG